MGFTSAVWYFLGGELLLLLTIITVVVHISRKRYGCIFLHKWRVSSQELLWETEEVHQVFTCRHCLKIKKVVKKVTP